MSLPANLCVRNGGEMSRQECALVDGLPPNFDAIKAVLAGGL